MDEVVAGETQSRTIQMRVLVVFTGVAIVLAGLGIYGLLAFTVSMRQQEFGIRLALGAGQGDIFKMVLVQGASLALAGLLPGMALGSGEQGSHTGADARASYEKALSLARPEASRR